MARLETIWRPRCASSVRCPRFATQRLMRDGRVVDVYCGRHARGALALARSSSSSGSWSWPTRSQVTLESIVRPRCPKCRRLASRLLRNSEGAPLESFCVPHGDKALADLKDRETAARVANILLGSRTRLDDGRVDIRKA